MTAYVLKRKRPPVLQYTNDYTKVGSPTITNNIVSGFSANNYLITKKVFNPLDADFEFVFKINLTSHTINVILAENRTGQFSKVYLCIGKDQKVFFGIGTGSAWRLRVYSNILLELNTDYWIKVVKSNGTFYIYYSLDGEDYILDNSVADTSVFPSITVEGRIGCWKDSSSGTSYFHGSIDLTESYIKLNGKYWWRGAKYVNVDKCYVLKRKRPTEYRKTVIDTATAGTYTFEVTKERVAKIILVGGGGGGGAAWSGHAAGSGAGSGACVYIKVKLMAGTYTITNGAAGLYASGNGGNSTFVKDGVTLITAGGGAGGGGGGNPPGNGGTYTISDNIEILEENIISNGNRGTQGTLYTTGIGGVSVYKGYGNGGNGSSNGVAGYIFVELTTDETDYDYKIDNDACYALKRKQYWKYGTEPNVTVVGSPTVDNGVVSGFSASNYLTLPMDFNPSSSPWSITTAIHFVDGSSGQRIFGSKGNIYGLALQTHTSTKTLHLYGSSNGSFWNLMSDLKGVTPLVDGTDYWVKMEYSGSQYIVSLSTNGVDWNDEITVNNATPLYAFKTFYIGSNAVETFLFGSIDLTQSYVKINNKLWWNGVKAIKATKDDYDFITD